MANIFMTMWTVYDHPTDFPDHYVARQHAIYDDNSTGPTDSTIVCDDLEILREQLRSRGMTPLIRELNDPAKIIETWI